MSQGYIIVDQALVYDAADGADVDVANASGGCLYTWYCTTLTANLFVCTYGDEIENKA